MTLIGIDHEVTNDLSTQWREAAPSMLGATATVGLEQAAVLSIWLAHSFGIGPDKGTHLIPIALDQEGKRIPSLEKQHRDCLRGQAGQPIFEEAERSRLLHEHIEPTLQRELGYRGITNPETGCSTELPAWIEIA